MGPEQAFGSADIDARTDVFSLGCVLYEMIVGARLAPYPGTERGRLGGVPAAHRRRLNELPRGMEALLARMVAWDAGERPASAVDVIGPLESFHRALRPKGEGGVRGLLTWLAKRVRH